MAAAVTLREASTPAPRPISQKMLREAEASLLWWHQERCGLFGEHGSGFEGSAMAWDAKAVGRLFDKVLDHRVEKAVEVYAKVLPVMQSLGPERRDLAAVLYEPRSTPDQYAHLDAVWPAIVHGAKACRVSAIAIVMRTAAARDACARAHGGKPPESTSQLLAWASEAIRPRVVKGRTINQESPKWAGVAMLQAQRLHDWILVEYATAALPGVLARKDAEARELRVLRGVGE